MLHSISKRFQNVFKSLCNGAARHSIGWAGVLLLAGLIATALVTRYIKTESDREAKRQFDFVCNEIQMKIQDRLDAHEQILRSGVAFFEHTGGVSREEWHRFTERQKVDQHLPGIQGIGFALLIPRQNLAQHVQEIRSQGFPQYQVRPEGERESYSSIIYLEPFTNRNLRAFGYDMLSEPVRRAAMERARDQDVAALSGKVVLVQETGTNVQAGTLMYVPVYRSGVPHDTIAQRREALIGWVYSPYRMADLMRGILGGWETTGGKQIHLEIFDSDVVSSDTLLYDSQSGETHLSHGPRSQRLLKQSAQPMLPLDNEVLADQRSAPQSFGAAQVVQQNSVISADRQWTLRFTPTGSRSFAMDYSKVWLMLFGGMSVSLLLSGLFFYLLNTRFKALKRGRELTDELRESKQSYHNQFASNSVAMLLVDPINGAIIDANATAIGFYGYPQERLLAMRIHQIATQPEHEIILAMATVTQGQSKRFEHKHILADGSIRDVEVSSSRIKFGVHMVLHLLIHDVTERNRAVEALNETRELLSLFMRHSPFYAFIKEVTPTESRVLLASENFHQMIGPLGVKIQGKTMSDLYPPELAAKIAADDRTVIASGEVIRLKEDFNGRNYDTIKFPIVRGAKTLVAGYMIDITERKRAEDALRESEAMQRTLMDNLPTGVTIVDPVTRVVERLNNYVATLVGRSVDNLAGQRCDALLECAKRSAETCHGCNLGQSESELLRTDGSRLPVLQMVNRIQWHGREKMLSCFVDLSERKRMEELLFQSTERLRLATRVGGVGIWDYEVAKNQLNWDDQMFRLYGISSTWLSY